MTKRQQAVARLKESGHYRCAGLKGGLKTRQRLEDDPFYYERITRKGGESTLRKYGIGHFKEIRKLRRNYRKSTHERQS